MVVEGSILSDKEVLNRRLSSTINHKSRVTGSNSSDCSCTPTCTYVNHVKGQSPLLEYNKLDTGLNCSHNGSHRKDCYIADKMLHNFSPNQNLDLENWGWYDTIQYAYLHSQHILILHLPLASPQV